MATLIAFGGPWSVSWGLSGLQVLGQVQLGACLEFLEAELLEKVLLLSGLVQDWRELSKGDPPKLEQ